MQFPKRPLFCLQICLDVHVGGVQAFVAKPKSNHCDFDRVIYFSVSTTEADVWKIEFER